MIQPDFAFALCLAVLLMVFFELTGGFAHESELFRRGALVTSAVAVAAAIWRLTRTKPAPATA